MNRYGFRDDYSEGVHEKILETLSKTNFIQQPGYGEDDFCKEAKKAILRKIEDQNADIYFVSGGTQANLIVISSVLNLHESVIAPSTGHIAVHEAGAIEASGHKINTIETRDGKLRPKDVQLVLNSHKSEHMVKPRLVFISDSTEIGTVYTRAELQNLSLFCKKNNLYLYLDGARLGSALTSFKNDLTLSDLSNLVDIFYIGGTKNGALFGEAIVIKNDLLKKNFKFYLKQKGALLSKSRVLGIQFLELFKDDLFFELGKHANLMAKKIAEGIERSGYDFLIEPSSNQIFPILPNELIEKLGKKYGFYIWKKMNNNKSVIRLVTSWATKEELVDQFIADL